MKTQKNSRDYATKEVLREIGVDSVIIENANSEHLWIARAYLYKEFKSDHLHSFLWHRGLANGDCYSYEYIAGLQTRHGRKVTARLVKDMDEGILNDLKCRERVSAIEEYIKGNWKLKGLYTDDKIEEKVMAVK